MLLHAALRFAAILIGAALFAFLLEKRWSLVSSFLKERSSPLNLAVVRIVLLFLLLSVVHLREELTFSTLDSSLLRPPPGWGHLARLLPRSPDLVTAIYFLFVISCFSGVIGLFTRAACSVVCLSAFYLLTLPQLFGKVSHNHHLLAFCFLLAISPCGDALYVDQYRRRRKGLPPPHPSRAYAAPLQCMMILIGLIYFFPGAWKVALAWPRWFSSGNMYSLIATVLEQAGGENSFQRMVLASPHLLLVGACTTVIFELGFIFAILPKRYRLWAAAAGILFHNLTNVLMGISFALLQLSYVVFVDWAKVFSWIRYRFRLNLSVQTGPSQVSSPAYGFDSSFRHPLGRVLSFSQVLLVSCFFMAGVLHFVNGWPIACFPTFDHNPNATFRKLTVRSVSQSGVVEENTFNYDKAISELFASDKWQGLLDSVINVEFRPKSAVALVRLWNKIHHPDERGYALKLRSANFFVDYYKLDLATGAQLLVRRQPLGVVSASDGL